MDIRLSCRTPERTENTVHEVRKTRFVCCLPILIKKLFKAYISK